MRRQVPAILADLDREIRHFVAFQAVLLCLEALAVLIFWP